MGIFYSLEEATITDKSGSRRKEKGLSDLKCEWCTLLIFETGLQILSIESILNFFWYFTWLIKWKSQCPLSNCTLCWVCLTVRIGLYTFVRLDIVQWKKMDALGTKDHQHMNHFWLAYSLMPSVYCVQSCHQHDLAKLTPNRGGKGFHLTYIYHHHPFFFLNTFSSDGSNYIRSLMFDCSKSKTRC